MPGEGPTRLDVTADRPTRAPARAMIRGQVKEGGRGVDAAFVLLVVAILAFAFTNGFHDAANAIATLVATEAPALARRSS